MRLLATTGQPPNSTGMAEQTLLRRRGIVRRSRQAGAVVDVAPADEPGCCCLRVGAAGFGRRRERPLVIATDLPAGASVDIILAPRRLCLEALLVFAPPIVAATLAAVFAASTGSGWLVAGALLFGALWPVALRRLPRRSGEPDVLSIQSVDTPPAEQPRRCAVS